MVMFLLLNFITTAAVVGNVVADPVGARVAASPKGGGGEATLNNRNGLLSFNKLYFGDTPLVATTVRVSIVSPHDAEAIVPNARVAHARATTVQGQALQQESKCESMVKRITCNTHIAIVMHTYSNPFAIGQFAHWSAFDKESATLITTPNFWEANRSERL